MHDALIQLIIHYKYALIILITIPEGPMIMLISGALVKLKHLELWPAFFSLLFGDLLADILWYCLGYFGGAKFINRFGKYFGVTKEHVEMMSKFYHKYHEWILLITKLTMAFGFAVVVFVTAGMVRIPFKRFLVVVAIGQLLWTSLLMFLGYTFLHLYVVIDDILGRVTLVVMACLILFAAYHFMKTMHKKIEKGTIE